MSGTDLIATCWTLAGDADPTAGRLVSPFALKDRIEAAAAVGYAGIGLWHGDLQLELERHSYHDIRAWLEDNGLRQIELEYLADWFADGAARQHSDAVRQDLFAAAHALGARHIKVMPPFGNDGWPRQRLIDEFGALCEAARRLDLKVALEMIPFSDLATLEAALDIVAGAGAANGGLLIDIWHVMRSGAKLDDILQIPASYILAAEVNDADLVIRGHISEDTMRHRKFCGDGEFDVAGFIAVMERAGYGGPYGVEILSDELRRMPLAQAAQRSFETASAYFV